MSQDKIFNMIKDMVKSNPNDNELGAKVRNFVFRYENKYKSLDEIFDEIDSDEEEDYLGDGMLM